MAWTVDGLSYSYRKLVTPTKPGAALTAYPLKVGIVADTDIGGRCLASGNDLRFTLQDGTLLYAEKDGFAVAAGAATGVFWVNVPSLASASDTPLYCYYGNAGAGVQAGATSVWNANMVAVWHAGMASGDMVDATANANTLADTGTPTYEATGAVGKCVSLPGSSSTRFSKSTALITTYPFTLSVWVNPNTITPIMQFALRVGKTGTWTDEFVLQLVYSHPTLRTFGQALEGHATSPLVAEVGQWYLMHGVGTSATDRVIYANGANPGSSTSAVTPSGMNRTDVGVQEEGTYVYPFDGLLDELRICNAALPVEWIAYDYLTQSTAAGGLTWGAEQASVSGIRRLNPYLSPGTNPGWM